MIYCCKQACRELDHPHGWKDRLSNPTGHVGSFVYHLYFEKTRSRLVRRSGSLYILSWKIQDPFLLNASEESTQPLFPLHRFRLRQWPFTSSCLCRFPLWPAVLRRAGGVAPFFSPSWIWENSLYCNCSQLQVYKSAFESFLSLALLSLFVSSFSVLCFWFVSVVSFPSKVLFCIWVFSRVFLSFYTLTHRVFFTKVFSLLHNFLRQYQGSLLSPSKCVYHSFPLCLSLKGTAAMDRGKTAWV